MNKEEILSKSKKENFYGDEYERIVRTIAIMTIKLFRTQSPADIICMMFCTSGLGFAYEGIHLKKKWQIIAGSLLLLCAAYFFYKFCMGVF